MSLNTYNGLIFTMCYFSIWGAPAKGAVVYLFMEQRYRASYYGDQDMVYDNYIVNSNGLVWPVYLDITVIKWVCSV